MNSTMSIKENSNDITTDPRGFMPNFFVLIYYYICLFNEGQRSCIKSRLKDAHLTVSHRNV